MKNSNMNFKTADGVDYLTFSCFDKLGFVKNAFSTKNGGVSKGIFKSMNLSYSRGDNEEDVKENYRRFFKAVNMNLNNVVMSDQIHETDIFVVTEENIKEFSDDFSKRKVVEFDGLMTNLKNVPLVTSYADCVPLYFADPVNKVIALSHSGWRGTAKGMAMKTVNKMVEVYNTKPEDIIAAIGPSIERKCYEVSSEVVEEYNKNFADKFDTSKVYDVKDNGKYQFDLWLANKLIMEYAGIKPENITISDICTACNSELLFSHRITEGKRGNLIAVMELC